MIFLKSELTKRFGSAALALAVFAGGAAAVLPMTAQESGIEAQAASSERDFYTEENDDGTLTVIGYKGTSGVANIPSSIFGQRVTKVGSISYEGKDFKSATSVVIPSSVTEIKDFAFYECTSLKSVTIPDSVKVLGESIFSGCTLLTTVRLPNKPDLSGYVPSEYMFNDCTSLKSLSIPNGWTLIPDYMFKGCTSLTSVTIPNSVKKIGGGWGHSFEGCSSLTSINIPDSVTEFGGFGLAFRDCTSLKSVRLSNNITEIPESTFENCSSLTELTIPNKVTSIGEYALMGCSSLKKLTIPASVTKISDSLFKYWSDDHVPTDLVIYGKKNSAADKFANNHDIPFKALIDATGIVLNTSGISLNAKETYQLKATIKPADTTVNTVTWKSSNTKVATVTSSGKVTAVNSGTADITGTTSNGKTAKCSVTVYGSPTSLSLSSSQMSLGLNETTKLTAKVGPQYAKDKSVKWRTSNSKVLTVDQKGNVKAKGKGTAWITARTVNGIEKSCKITVKNAPSSVKLPNAVLTLGVGETYKLGAIIPDNSAAASRTFRTSNSSVVKMTKTNWEGQFKAMKTGTAYVTVRLYNGKEASCKVTVKKAPASVNLNKTNITMKVGQTGSLSAVISPSDAGCATRTFRTSNASIVKMTKTNWTGQFKAVKKGVAWVTVRTYNGKEKSCKITVV